MSSSSKALSTEVGNLSNQNAFAVDAYLSHCSESHLEHVDEEKNEGEDEDEDVDFNPFLKESPSLEASSSLSSEVEVLDADVANSKRKTLATNLSPMPSAQVQDYAVGDSEHGEEIVMQTAISSSGAGEEESENLSPMRFKKRTASLICQSENKTFHRKEDASSSGTDIFNDLMVEEITHSKKSIMDIDDEDAICKRTRARYSLASFTLDELETFLQETDDDDDLQNVNDEEEYRKFLAAVLQGGDGDSLIIQGNENADDEDEENDADFEIEIEEALESDLDENTRGVTQEEREAASRCPETRQKRRQKASVRQKNRLLGQGNRPLRPLLPNAPVSSFPVLLPETASHFLSSSGRDGFVNGFTPHQLGQLHCLVHEHVQLLIQVFSLCVLEPARQHIASQVRELISEMLHKREQVISQRRVPYPCFYFCPPYIHPSVRHGIPKSLTTQFTCESACSFDEKRECSSITNKGLPPCAISPSKEKSGYTSNGQEGRLQIFESTLWVPFINGPIVSVLDVAPLTLVGKFIDDVSIAVREYHRQHVQAACDTHFKKEPLFPFQCSQSFAEANADILRGSTLPTPKVLSYSAGDQPPKKSLAAALVERTKMQSIALVPKEIANLAERFLPLFNPALFPHKPPPAPVANRVLFTDAEDELLAMGLMEYNTDWKAIQQRFLPCKSKHQIFVRQKNRSSSKAPENSIKAVRRMKSSPLTAEEMARIQEGLKVFKLDWMSVWKFVVPYRDPSLLPRQWRIATGTQKSYKSTADKKEKRRLYESNRRKSKPAALESWQTSYEKQNCQTDNAGGENNSGEDCMDNEDEAYVHEAFLADWRPGTTFSVFSWFPVSNLGERGQPCELPSHGGSCVREQTNTTGSGECQPQIGLEFSAAFRYSQNLDTLSRSTNTRHYASAVEPNHPVSGMTLRPSRSQFCSRPYRSRKTNSAHLVKLAPDLPPVNLPPSVRIMPQSAFKSYLGGASSKFPATDASTEKIVSPLPHLAISGSSHAIKSAGNKRYPIEKSNANQHQQESIFLGDKCFAGDKGESDLQMHPLLFQSSGDGNLQYYPLNGGDSSSFNFFSRIQPHLNLSLLYNPHKANQSVNHFDKSSKSNQSINHFDKSSKSNETTSPAGDIDFHPLLQKADDVNSDSVTAHSIARLSVNLEPLRESCDQLQHPCVAGQSEPRASSCLSATCPKSSSPNQKAKELDLDIHLSFAPRKEIAIRSRDVAENNPMASNLSALASGTTMETQATDKSSSYQCSEYCPTASIPNTMGNKLDSGAHALVVSSNNISMYDSGVNNGDDQSLPEIVMEQEELSDSDEEIGEHVEFECEEMDDSEGDEGSDAEQNTDIQTKDNSVRDKFTGDDQQCEARGHGKNLQCNVCQIPECGTSKLSLKALGKGKPSSPLCLSLNSCAPGCPPPNNQTKAKAVESTVMEGSTGKNCSASPPGLGSCKKPLSHRKHVTEMPQQQEKRMESGSLAITTALRGPRKIVCKSNAGLSMGRPRKRESNVNTDVTVENSQVDRSSLGFV